MLGWSRCGYNKKCLGSRHGELVFLHPVRSVCHIVRSGVFGAQNVCVLFSCSGGPDVDPRKSVT
jgi:hypothetical protein